MAFLGYPHDTLWEPVWSEAQAASRTLSVDIVPMPFSSQGELDTAFRNLSSRVEALLVAPQPFIYTHRRAIFELALQRRLPAIYEFRHYPAHGGLMSYGPVYPALYRKAARLVDAILKGAKPADLPVELPTEFELVLNLRTAKAMGLTIPERFLQAVDEVIQ